MKILFATYVFTPVTNEDNGKPEEVREITKFTGEKWMYGYYW